MTRGISLLVALTFAIAGAGCAGQGAGGSAMTPAAPASGLALSREPAVKPPLAGAIVVGDYYGASVQYLAPKTGKMLYTISGNATKLSYPAAVAVDRHHNTYVLGHFDNAANDEVSEILVFDAKAPLQAHPKPVRRIVGSNTQLAFGYLAVDSVGRIYVTVQNPANAILVFAKNANGNVAPTRVITGALTQLAGTNGIAIARHGAIVVATYGKVLTFPRTASGNVAPTSTLNAGTGSTQLTGLSFDSSGDLLVGDYGGAIYAFAANASGTAAPLWTLAGRRTKLLNPFSAVADKGGYIFASFSTTTGGEVGIYKPGGGNTAPRKHVTFTFPSTQIAVMP